MKNNFFHSTAASLVLAAVAVAPTALAQHVTMLEVRKDGGDDHRTTIEIRAPMELQGLDLDNPMDGETSGILSFTDDQGTNFLKIHEQQQAELRAQGYTTQSPMSFGGVADYGANKDVKIRVAVDAAAAEGAGKLRIAGKAVFNFAGEGGPETLEVTDVPVEMPYDSEGFASEIGPIIISAGSSAELNDVTYRKFSVGGTENSIVSAKPVGGDDSGEVEFWGVAPNEFVFKDVPEVVSLQIEYTPVRKVPVDFDLEFSVGL